MAGMDTQKQLFSLIRDFASEKSQGERRVCGLKKQIEELRSAVDKANAELEEAKRCREAAEQELKGFEVERSLNESTIQTLEARVSSIQDEISTINCDMEDLKINFIEVWNCAKNKEGSARDEFIGKMFETNTKIRNFMDTVGSDINKEDDIGNFATDFVPQRNSEEEMLLAEQDTAKKVQEEFVALEKKDSLMEAITKETTTLSELTNSELEQKCTHLFEELQRRCVCPHCHRDNVDTLGETLQLNISQS